MRLIFHGGAGEVGRSCIEIATDRRRLLLDCGLKLTSGDTEYPVGFDTGVNDIDAVFISHAHLDHTGALPVLDHMGMDCPIFATKATKDLTRLLLRDAFKIGKITHQHLGYTEADIRDVLKCMQRVKMDQKGKCGDITYEFFDAGHIPGAASIFIEIDGKTFLYTGDINTQDTQLHAAAESDFPEIDIMLCESTYGDRDHPPRKKTEEQFLEEVKTTIDNRGTAVIPVFAVGRAQEMIMLLNRQKWGVPIYLDGMSVTAGDIALANPQSIRDPRALARAMKKVNIVKRESERKEAVRNPAIIVTTSGMLTGGPVLYYLRYLINEPKNSIILTGYQVEDTNGRMLLDDKMIFIDGKKRDVLCNVKQFDFSAHSGLSELKALVRKVRPKKIVWVHGDPPAIENMHEWAQALGMESHAPKVGDKIDL